MILEFRWLSAPPSLVSITIRSRQVASGACLLLILILMRVASGTCFFFTSEPPVYQSDLLSALSLLLLLLVVVANPNLLKHFVHSMYHQTRWFGKYRQYTTIAKVNVSLWDYKHTKFKKKKNRCVYIKNSLFYDSGEHNIFLVSIWFLSLCHTF